MLKFERRSRTSKFGDRKDKVVHYASQTASPRVTLKAVEDEIVRMTSLARGDVRNAIASLTEVVNNHLANGFAVDLGDLGSFRVTASGKFMDKVEDVTAKSIKKPKVQHTPKGEMRQAALKVGFEVLGDKDDDKKTPEKPKQPATPQGGDNGRGNAGL